MGVPSGSAKERAPLRTRAGLRIRGFQLQQPCLRLVCPFCDRLRAGGAEVRQNENPARACDVGGTKGGVLGTLMQVGWGRRLEGSVRETHGRARGSSRNVRHQSAIEMI